MASTHCSPLGVDWDGEVVSAGGNQAVMGGRARDGSSHVPCCPGKPHHQSRADNLWLLRAPTDCALVERNGQAALVLATHSRSHGVGDREQEALMGRGSDHSRVQWAPQADWVLLSLVRRLLWGWEQSRLPCPPLAFPRYPKVLRLNLRDDLGRYVSASAEHHRIRIERVKDRRAARGLPVLSAGQFLLSHISD